MKKLILVLVLFVGGCTSTGYISEEVGKSHVRQPGNPKGESSHRMDYEKTTTTTKPDGTTIVERVSQKSQSRVGGTFEDTGAKIKAVMDGMAACQWVGIALTLLGLPIAVIAAKRGWKVNSVLLGLGISGSGIAMLCLYAFLPQINPYFGLAGLLLVIVAAGVWFGYKRGEGDASA